MVLHVLCNRLDEAMENDKSKNWGHSSASTPLACRNEIFSFLGDVSESSGFFSNSSTLVGSDQIFSPLTPLSTTSPQRQTHGPYQPNPTPSPRRQTHGPYQPNPTPSPWRQTHGPYQPNPTPSPWRQTHRPYLPNPTPSPWRQTHGPYQPNPYAVRDVSSNLIVDLNQPPTFQNTVLDPNRMNVAGYIPNFYQQHSPLSVNEGMGLSLSNVNIEAAESGLLFKNTELDQNFSPMGGNTGGYIDMATQVGCSDFVNTHGPHIKCNRGGGKTMFYPSQHSGGTSSFHQNQLNAAQIGSSKIIDDKLVLSLGIEGRTDVPKPDFGNRVSVGNIDRVVPSTLDMSHVQAAGTSLNQVPNLGFQDGIDGLSCFQNNVGGLVSTRNNAGGLNSSSITSYLPNSSPLRAVQRPQAYREHGFLKPSDSSRGFMSNEGSRHANVDPYKVLRGQMDARSGAFGSSSAGSLGSAQIGASNVGPSFVNFPGAASQLAASSGAFGSSSAGFLGPAQTGASSLGQSSVNFLGTASQPTSDQLQKMLKDSRRNNLPENFPSNRYRGSSTRRGFSGHVFPSSSGSAAQALNESAQHLTRKSNPLAGQMVSSPESYGHLQVSNIHGIQPRKRGIIHPNPSLSRVQRQKMELQYPISPYVSPSPQTAPAGSTPIHVPASSKGSGRVPRPSGHKCMICKRDLAFAPEGPIHNPSVPPVVAVLPCQHTFHDHCLERITPEDQAKCPPCIPCALGEI